MSQPLVPGADGDALALVHDARAAEVGGAHVRRASSHNQQKKKQQFKINPT
jgi:hypothetical protein